MSEGTGRCGVTSCELGIRVRYNEVDRMGAVHNSHYPAYFELGRTELLRQNGHSYKSLEDAGVLLVVARLEVRFKSPARYDDELVLRTSRGKVDRVRLEHVYELRRPADGQVIATGRTVLVHVDREGRLQGLPEMFWAEEMKENPKY